MLAGAEALRLTRPEFGWLTTAATRHRHAAEIWLARQRREQAKVAPWHISSPPRTQQA